MKKLLHHRTKIFFPNPYVVRLEHDDLAGDQMPGSFMKLAGKVRKSITGTWGCTRPEYEQVKVKNDFNQATPPAPFLPLTGLAHQLVLASLFNPDYVHVLRSYWCFADELDALQFRLMIGSKATHVHIWPERFFTIHEVIHDDES